MLLSRLLTRGWRDVEDAAARIRDFDPDWLVLAARGTSDNAARYAQYVFGAFNHLYAGLATAVPVHRSTREPPQLGRALTIGISQSGQSPDVVSVIREAREQGGLTIAITNDDRSPIGSHRRHLPAIARGPRALGRRDQDLYQSALVASDAQPGAGRRSCSSHGAGGAPALGRASVGNESLHRQAGPGLQRLRAFLRSRSRVLLLDRARDCTQDQGDLLCDGRIPTLEPTCSTGPLPWSTTNLPVILLATEGRSCASILELGEVLLERGARIIAISDRAELCSRAQTAICDPQCSRVAGPHRHGPPRTGVGQKAGPGAWNRSGVDRGV